ncbi:ABC transporter permease [candidate division KSB1 bacterium]
MKTKIFKFKGEIPKYEYILLGCTTFLLVIIFWQLLCSFNIIREYFLPSPFSVLKATIELFTQYSFFDDLKASFFRVSVGYLFAVLLAIPIGVLVGSFRVFEALIEPLNDFIRYTPLPAFIPLIILWVGIGNLNQISIIFLGVFWSLIVMVSDAIGNVPKELLETSYTLGIPKKRILMYVIVPYALPGIYDSLRVAIGWAWSSLILAEIVGANSGIGHMITESQRFLRTANVISGIIIVGMFGLILDYLFKAFYKPLFPWAEKSR